MNNEKEIEKKIYNIVLDFENKIKEINENNIDIKEIKNIKIKENKEIKNIEKICYIKNDKEGNIILTPLNKINAKTIEKEINKIKKGEYKTYILNKEEIIIKKNNLTDEEGKKKINKMINQKKEEIKIKIREIRKKEIKKNNNEEEKKHIQKIIDKYIKNINQICEKKLKI